MDLKKCVTTFSTSEGELFLSRWTLRRKWKEKSDFPIAKKTMDLPIAKRNGSEFSKFRITILRKYCPSYLIRNGKSLFKNSYRPAGILFRASVSLLMSEPSVDTLVPGGQLSGSLSIEVVFGWKKSQEIPVEPQHKTPRNISTGCKCLLLRASMTLK
ncbi:hypothetical protein CEXT_435601 [Caerostris extrusa]|uniref:Uncharacterized protein n=1 Tax=Caerostris extrusa TaxID=172846 RepID=A0AAV4V1D7_CAEEX|nr:hypothetical protein CEXT_435601 [Caerostris extrusa]